MVTLAAGLRPRVEHGDCLEVIPRLVAEGVLVDAIVTDPPYHLTSGNLAIDWGAFGPRTDGGSDRGPTNGSGRKTGFMGKRWDGGDVAFRPETWSACYRVLKPGGYLLAFGGERTFHRQWCAIEDAGFILQTTICWLWGSGFPKHKADLKPSWNPVCVAYKPGGKRELQIDECRVPAERRTIPIGARINGNNVYGNGLQGDHHSRAETPEARWPANVCHDGSDEVMEAFAAFGEKPSKPFPENWAIGDVLPLKRRTAGGFLDTGTAARFFYCAKASKADRAGSKHPTVKPIALMRWLVRLVTPPKGTVLDPFAGSGTIAAAAIAEGRNAILIEREAEYLADIKRRLKAHKAAA